MTFQPGDTWVGVRLRPEYGVTVWRDRLNTAQDTVLRGKAAVDLIPGLGATTGIGTLTDLLATLTKNTADSRLPGLIDAIHASGGRIRIERLATFAGWSTRHLNRVFRDHLGLSVKTYAQLVQFHRTLKLIRVGRLPLTAAAYEGGYSDQAHLARAFRRFGGFAPSAIPQELSIPTLFPA
ncbi:helix-turn-helix transcriptional regulator [Shimia ponticola]|uniref:helix-turn-helix transcriptional regulator n=1 Tax=Shimia ponticola TaxID=2582893 RepID=UPI00164C3896|nr:helix-turn-helix transcriptional regulator [Shimia ponticola]